MTFGDIPIIRPKLEVRFNGAALAQAAGIVSDRAKAKDFLDSYQPGENPQTHVLLYDSRVLVVGHSANKAACVAISAAVQTCAAIARSLRCVKSVDLFENENKEAVYDIQFAEGQRARRIIAGLAASFAGISRTSKNPETGEEALLLSDQRKLIPPSEKDFAL